MTRLEEFTIYRSQGMTYKEIAEKCGVSRQYVAQTCAKGNAAHFKAYTKDECVYEGLRNWLNSNFVNRYGLWRIIKGVEINAGSWYVNLRHRIEGITDFKKSEIDRLLDASGLTYEQLFRAK
jgi:transcriptional regulator with XRE-family HTH domain